MWGQWATREPAVLLVCGACGGSERVVEAEGAVRRAASLTSQEAKRLRKLPHARSRARALRARFTMSGYVDFQSKAKELLGDAEAQDQAGNYGSALLLYKAAQDYFQEFFKQHQRDQASLKATTDKVRVACTSELPRAEVAGLRGVGDSS